MIHRWMKSTTTHPESGRLKSYSSSPSLVTAIPSVLKEGDEELLNLQEPSPEGSPFFNPLYKFSHPNLLHQQHNNNNNHTSLNNPNNNFHSPKCTSTTSTGSSGIALSADDDSQSDRSRSSLSNPVSSYSPSPPPTSNIGGTGILRQQIVYNSSRPNGLQKYNSLTDFSEEDLYTGDSSSNHSASHSPKHHNNASRSLSESPYGLNSSGLQSQLGDHIPPVSDVVLVEVIRKPESPSKNKDNRTVVGVVAEKRHSIGEVDPIICNKFAGVKVEGSPGKVARIKESIKKFGRFGRNHSEKILRFQSDDVLNSSKVEDPVITNSGQTTEAEISEEVNNIPPKPAARKSKAPEVPNDSKTPTTKTSTTSSSLKESKTESHEIRQTPALDNSGESDQNAKASDITETSEEIPSAKTKPKQETILVDELKPKIDIKPEQIPNHQDDNENEPPVSIIGDQDRSMSSHIQLVPTIDIQSCLDLNENSSSSNTLYSATPVVPAIKQTSEVVVVVETTSNNSVAKSAAFDEVQSVSKGVTGDTDKVEVHTDDSCGLSGQDKLSSSSSSQEFQMLRRQGGSSGVGGNGTSHGKIINKLNANSYSSVNGQVNHSVRLYNGNVNASPNNRFSSSLAPDTDYTEEDEIEEEEHSRSYSTKGIGHGKHSRHSNNNGK